MPDAVTEKLTEEPAHPAWSAGSVEISEGRLAVIPQVDIAPWVENTRPLSLDPGSISIASWAIMAPLNIELAPILTAAEQNQYTFLACVPFRNTTFAPGVDAKAPKVLITNTASGLP